jgi:hypothetical protein
VDFALDETQRTAMDVARETLSREPAESVWKALAQAGLLSLAIPERLGGENLGLLQVSAVLTEVGRAAAQLPALHTLALGVLPVVRFGSERQQDELLPEVAAGDRLLTAALRGGPAIVDGGRLSGSWAGVGYAAAAYRVLVPAMDGLYLVDPRSSGVSLVRTPTSSGVPEFSMRLAGARGEPLGGQPIDLRRLAVAGACAVGSGLVAGALALTAEHVRTREQFGRPLATFQAVAQQIADVYIASRTLDVAAWSAVWRLSAELEADADLAVARYWFGEEAVRAMQVCHHLHGGLGVDVSYPLHRYYSLTKDLVRCISS